MTLAGLSSILLLLGLFLLCDGTFLHVMHLSCVHCWLLFIASVQSSGILPACISASVRRVGLQRRARSCLPSLCAPRASVFALQGVPQPEGLSGLCRVAGRTNLQGGGGPGAQLVRCVAAGAVSRGSGVRLYFTHPSGLTAGAW